jgi:hypothetical protein
VEIDGDIPREELEELSWNIIKLTSKKWEKW